MAGNKTIYLVYDQKVETEGTLQKLITNVLSKAGFPISNIYLVNSQQVLDKIVEGKDQYFICLNKTYPTTTIKLASMNKIPTFNFYVKLYKGDKIMTLNLPYSIEEIFRENNNKKLVWESLVSFLSAYKDYMEMDDEEETIKTEPKIKEQDIKLSSKVEEVKVIPVKKEVEVPIIGDLIASTQEVSFNLKEVMIRTTDEDKVKLYFKLKNYLSELYKES